MTMTGAVVGIITAALAIAQSFGLPLTESEASIVAQNIGVIIASGAILFGLSRKVVTRLGRVEK